MKNIVRLTAILLILTVTLSGCYYDKANELYPNESCADTANHTYSKSIKQLMANKCDVCHASSVANGGVITDNYNDLIKVDTGQLMMALEWTGPRNTQMPSGAIEKLSICDRYKVKKWIQEGSKNN